MASKKLGKNNIGQEKFSENHQKSEKSQEKQNLRLEFNGIAAVLSTTFIHKKFQAWPIQK